MTRKRNFMECDISPLQIIQEIREPYKKTRLQVKCFCGVIFTSAAEHLLKRRIRSCGCLRSQMTSYMNKSHGMSKTRQYVIWQCMKRRCTVPLDKGYINYGGRGITYDPKWETFEGFWEDMEDGYSDKLELDRIDVNGYYTKENCRWTNNTEQNFNTRKRKDNTSGKTGVYFKRGWWFAIIYKDKVEYNLGRFKTLEEAVCAREQAELDYYGYTKE